MVYDGSYEKRLAESFFGNQPMFSDIAITILVRMPWALHQNILALVYLPATFPSRIAVSAPIVAMNETHGTSAHTTQLKI